MIDHTPPINVIAAPINSLDKTSVVNPFATNAPPINVNACLTIPSICSFCIIFFRLFLFFIITYRYCNIIKKTYQ